MLLSAARVGGVAFQPRSAGSQPSCSPRCLGAASRRAGSCAHGRAAERAARLRCRASSGDAEVKAASDGDDAGGPLSDLSKILEAQLQQELQRRRGLILFEQEMQKDDSEIDARACLYIAMHERPDIDVDAHIAQLDEMGRELSQRLPPPDLRVTRRMLKAINAYLFEELGFRGANAGEAASPDASCLDQVMRRRMGLPIMLSLVYLELARRVGFEMIGVNLPAHFMIRPVVEGSELLVDPFRMGELIDVETAEERLAALYGKGVKVKIDRAFFEDNVPKPRTFLTRVLTNLKQVYYNKGQHDLALLMIDYQDHAAPDNKIRALNTRDRGICLFYCKRYADAISELQGYVEQFPDAVDGSAIATLIEFCREGQKAQAQGGRAGGGGGGGEDGQGGGAQGEDRAPPPGL